MTTNTKTSLRTLLGAAALAAVALSCTGTAWATQPPDPDRCACGKNGTSLDGIDRSIPSPVPSGKDRTQASASDAPLFHKPY